MASSEGAARTTTDRTERKRNQRSAGSTGADCGPHVSRGKRYVATDEVDPLIVARPPYEAPGEGVRPLGYAA